MPATVKALHRFLTSFIPVHTFSRYSGISLSVGEEERGLFMPPQLFLRYPGHPEIHRINIMKQRTSHSKRFKLIVFSRFFT